MKNVAVLFFFITCFFSCTSQRKDNSGLPILRHEEGYLLFLPDNRVVFTAITPVERKFDLSKLKSSRGIDITGYLVDRVNSLKSVSQSFEIFVNLISDNKIVEVKKELLLVVPIKLTYRTTSNPTLDDNAFPFSYDNIPYVITYDFSRHIDIINVDLIIKN